MREHGGEVDKPGRGVERRGLHRRDLVTAQAFANDIEPTGKRRITERALAVAKRRADRPDQRLFRVGEFDLGLGQGRRDGAD